MKKTRIGDLLLENRLITEKQLQYALDVKHLHNNKKIGEILCHYQFITDKDIAKMLAQQVGWKYFDGEYCPDNESIDSLGIDFLLERSIYPLKSSNGKIFAIPNIDDTKSTDFIKEKYFQNAHFMVGAESLLRSALDQLYSDISKKSITITQKEIREEKNIDFLKPWFNELLNKALLKNASDIHIESTRMAIEIRFRIDGVLVFEECLDKAFQNPLANIIFGISDIDISSFNKFHDAKFEHKYLNKNVDVRISHIPSVHGSAFVLRLLDKGRATVPITELGYSPHNMNLLMKALNKPYGIILMTGPTGCGKTTSLYSILSHLKSISKKIVTIEDPIEVSIPIITQVQINHKQDVTYENASRAFLRHDPDIMLIGEIRDPETASIAVKASLTGHQVFSTLHTISPVDSLLRLQDLGVKVSFIANSLICVVAQRLVRKLCPSCKYENKVVLEEVPLEQQKYLTENLGVVYEAKGCDYCVDGYKGRVPVIEVLYITEEIRDRINQDRVASIYNLVSNDDTYRSFTHDATRLIKKGVTSLREVTRILG